MIEQFRLVQPGSMRGCQPGTPPAVARREVGGGGPGGVTGPSGVHQVDAPECHMLGPEPRQCREVVVASVSL